MAARSILQGVVVARSSSHWEEGAAVHKDQEEGGRRTVEGRRTPHTAGKGAVDTAVWGGLHAAAEGEAGSVTHTAVRVLRTAGGLTAGEDAGRSTAAAGEVGQEGEEEGDPGAAGGVPGRQRAAQPPDGGTLSPSASRVCHSLPAAAASPGPGAVNNERYGTQATYGVPHMDI